jgi:hypothetical protein
MATGWRAAWTPSRARLWLLACAACAWLPALFMPLRQWLDYAAFHAAGALAFTPDVSRLAPIIAFEDGLGIPITPFVYPPGIALAYIPFAALPYQIAGALHLAVMLGLLVVSALLGARLLGLPERWALLGTLAWAPAAAGVISGQNTALALLLTVVGAMALARGGNRLAGIAVGLLCYKPQLGAPLVGLLALRGRWAAVATAALVIGFQYLAGLVATGGNLAWPRDWLDTVQAYTTADFVANGWQAISLPALGRHLELATGIPGLAILGFVVAGAIVLACVPHMRRLPPVESVALASACGLLVSPHAWVYDATLLLPALGVLAARAAAHGWPWRDRWTVAAAFAVGLSWPLGGFLGVTLLPLLVVAVPLLLVRPAPPTDAPQAAVAVRVGSLPLGQ